LFTISCVQGGPAGRVGDAGQTGREQDPFDLHQRRVDVVVDDAVAVAVGLEEFTAGHFQPPGHRLRRLGAPALEPLQQLVGVRGLDEDRDRVRIPLEDRECTLHVDLQHDPLSGRQPRGHLGGQGAVPVLPAVDPAAFQELTLGPPPLELGKRNEVVVDAVAFPGAGGAGGGRHARHELGQRGQEPPQDRALADPGGAGNDDEFARPDFHPDVVPRVCGS